MKINYTSGCICDSLTIDGKESADLSPKVIKDAIVKALKQQYNYQIEFYKETEYGTC